MTHLLDHGPVCTVETLHAIAELTEDGMTAKAIADRLGIGVRSVQKGRRIMGARGYNPLEPGQPIDEVAVLRAARGERIHVHVDERREAIETLHRRRMPAAEIARTLGCCKRTVERHVAKLRAA